MQAANLGRRATGGAVVCCPDKLLPLLLPAIVPSFDIRSIAELRRIIIVLVWISCKPFSFNSTSLKSSKFSDLTDNLGGNGGGLKSRGGN